MKRKIWGMGRCVLAAAVLCAAAPGFAQVASEVLIAEADANGDGRLNREETPIDLLPEFEKIDANGDSVLDSFELYDYRQARAKARKGRGPRQASPAEPRPPGQAAEAGPRRIETAEEYVRLLDRNGDGFATLDEAPRSRHDLLLRLDLDGDHRVSLDEARSVDAGRVQGRDRSRPSRRSLQRTVVLMDTDGDGLLQRREAPLAVQTRFDRLDANGDGAIDADEAAAGDAAGR